MLLHRLRRCRAIRRFYTEVLGGKVVFGPEPTNIALANSFIVINGGGGPTDDKPSVILETPTDPDRVSSFLNIRVTDIQAVYAEWSARGAPFLNPRSSTSTKPVATSEIPTVTSSRSGKPPNHKETGGLLTGHRSIPACNPTELRLPGAARTDKASDPGEPHGTHDDQSSTRTTPSVSVGRTVPDVRCPYRDRGPDTLRQCPPRRQSLFWWSS